MKEVKNALQIIDLLILYTRILLGNLDFFFFFLFFRHSFAPSQNNNTLYVLHIEILY